MALSLCACVRIIPTHTRAYFLEDCKILLVDSLSSFLHLHFQLIWLNVFRCFALATVIIITRSVSWLSIFLWFRFADYEKSEDFANYFHPAHMYVVDIPSGVGDLIRAYTLASSLHFHFHEGHFRLLIFQPILITIWMQMAKGRHLVAISLDRFECGRDNDISPFRISLFLEICDFTQNQKVASFQLLKWQQELQNGTNP